MSRLHHTPGKRDRASAKKYSARRSRIRTLHENGAGGFATSLRLTSLVDSILLDSYRQNAAGSSFAVVGLGGYGRRELSFASDVDSMVLVSDEPDGSAAKASMQAFYHGILDFGLDVGHSFRTIENCLELRENDLDAWISLLDARFLCGNSRVFQQFLRALRASLKGLSTPRMLERIMRLSDERHARYGRSTKLLEPNIKNSAGGFRDIQTVLWLLRITGRLPVGPSDSKPALKLLLEAPSLHALFPRSFLSHARTSVDMLLRIRHQMHLDAGSLHDTLEFSAQTSTAHHLRFRSSGSSSDVERFMRSYYDAANAVAELHARVLHWAHDRWITPKKPSTRTVVDGDLRLRAGKLSLAKNARLTTHTALRAFALRVSSGTQFSFSFEDAIQRSLSVFRPLRSKADAGQFCELFRLSRGTAETLRQMNRLGLLSRWVPEWRPLVRFFQHNQYHYFTADEHTLTVVENAEALQDDPSTFGDVFRKLPRRDVLYFACLFHDITKPARLDDHERTGATVAREVLTRWGRSDRAEDVAFLVRNHLVMEQIAFRRNLSDRVTIRDFASRFPRPELLRYLYVLTYADLASVNRSVLTDWKRSLLTELYTKTNDILDPEGSEPHPVPLMKPERPAETMNRSDAEQHASLLLDETYVQTFSRQEISEHVRALHDLGASKTLFHHWSDVTGVTLLTRDAPFVLARMCGVLYANDLNIIDARIFTREDGIVIDKFRVVDSQTHRPLTEERCRSVETEVHDVLSGECSVEDLLERHRLRWKRRHKPSNPNVRVDVVFEEHPSYTIIDVFGADTAGFLFRVADAISRTGCAIHFAKIATRADGIVDSFYVLDAGRGPIRSETRKEEVRSVLLDTIRSLYDGLHGTNGAAT